jgi:hypothetical protein
VECANNLRNIGLALHAYHGVNGCFPKKANTSTSPVSPDKLLSWFADILPFVDGQTIYDEAILDCQNTPNTSRISSIHQHRGFGRTIKIYGCPADGRYGSAAQQN